MTEIKLRSCKTCGMKLYDGDDPELCPSCKVQVVLPFGYSSDEAVD